MLAHLISVDFLAGWLMAIAFVELRRWWKVRRAKSYEFRFRTVGSSDYPAGSLEFVGAEEVGVPKRARHSLSFEQLESVQDEVENL